MQRPGSIQGLRVLLRDPEWQAVGFKPGYLWSLQEEMPCSLTTRLPLPSGIISDFGFSHSDLPITHIFVWKIINSGLEVKCNQTNQPFLQKMDQEWKRFGRWLVKLV
ncbi:hypothetical protein ATANTOWER_025343 [Ataeniobius toweri]|uniref:Uncharacterized protein n=1 Tax=Ataeniobius toweri TaxID=208326 RepID=A0ABU7BWF1_9TELE|nr:hypothetical protein [Ataeniobius toweri]